MKEEIKIFLINYLDKEFKGEWELIKKWSIPLKKYVYNFCSCELIENKNFDYDQHISEFEVERNLEDLFRKIDKRIKNIPKERAKKKRIKP